MREREREEEGEKGRRIKVHSVGNSAINYFAKFRFKSSTKCAIFYIEGIIIVFRLNRCQNFSAHGSIREVSLGIATVYMNDSYTRNC